MHPHITFNHNIRDCCICGNHNAPEIVFDFNMVTSGVRCDAWSETHQKMPVCFRCRYEWQLIEHRIGREMSLDEILIYILAGAKTKKIQSTFLRKCAGLNDIEVTGEIYFDFLNALNDRLGNDHALVCPECNSHGVTKR